MHKIVVDVNFGDSSKGSIVDYLTLKDKSTLTVRFSGGSQAAHNVITETGLHHTFSNFGSGSLRGADTLYIPKMLVNPHFIVKENEVLKKKMGYSFLPKLFIHEDCWVTTPFHVNVNRALAKFGETCGMGIGETIDSYQNPDLIIRAGDLWNENLLAKKLTKLYHHYNFKALIGSKYEIGYCEVCDIIELYREFSKHITIVYDDQAAEMIARNTTIFEGAQGILLDENYGFNPYTTWSTTTTKNADDFLTKHNLSAKRIGVTRSYATRHGAGPLVSEIKGEHNFVELHNKFNDFQHGFRVGHFDFVMFKYALEVQKESAGHELDEIALTHHDAEIDGFVEGYKLSLEGQFIDNAYSFGSISQLNKWEVDKTLSQKEHFYSDLLKKCRPIFTSCGGACELGMKINEICPISIISDGPRSDQKVSV